MDIDRIYLDYNYKDTKIFHPQCFYDILSYIELTLN